MIILLIIDEEKSIGQKSTPPKQTNKQKTLNRLEIEGELPQLDKRHLQKTYS